MVHHFRLLLHHFVHSLLSVCRFQVYIFILIPIVIPSITRFGVSCKAFLHKHALKRTFNTSSRYPTVSQDHSLTELSHVIQGLYTFYYSSQNSNSTGEVRSHSPSLQSIRFIRHNLPQLPCTQISIVSKHQFQLVLVIHTYTEGLSIRLQGLHTNRHIIQMSRTFRLQRK